MRAARPGSGAEAGRHRHRPDGPQRRDRPVRAEPVGADRGRRAGHRGRDLLRARQRQLRQQDDVGAGRARPGRRRGRRGRVLQPPDGQDGAAARLGGHRRQRPPGHLPARPRHRARSRAAGPTPATTWRWARRCWPRCWSPWSAGWACSPRSCGGSSERGTGGDGSPGPGASAAGSPASTRRRRPRTGTRSPRASCCPGSACRRDIRFFTPAQEAVATALCDQLLGQDGEPLVPLVRDDRRPAGRAADRRLALRGHARGRPGLAGHAGRLDADARGKFGCGFAELPAGEQQAVIQAVQDLGPGDWHGLTASRVWSLWTRYACTAFYSHPAPGTRSASPARPTRAATRTPASGKREPFEVADASPGGGPGRGARS